MGHNQLNGTIPDAWYNLTNLQTLRLCNNNLTGPLKPAIGNLKSLLELSLDRNQFTGTIPDAWYNLTSLKFLYLYDNNLTGPLQPAIGNLQSLVELLHFQQPTDWYDSIGAIRPDVARGTLFEFQSVSWLCAY
jgi:Leucine rich repeat